MARVLLIFPALLLFTADLPWAQGTLPGAVWSLHTANDGTIYAGTSTDGVYVSVNDGQSFHPAGAPQRHVWDVLTVGNAVLAAVEQGPLLISFDGQTAYQEIDIVPNGAHGYDLSLREGGHHVYLATWGSGAFRAHTNDLTTWTDISANLPELAVTAIEVDGPTGTVLATVLGNGVWRLAAGETGWVQTSALGDYAGWSVTSQCDHFYVGTWLGGAFRSADNGITFVHAGLDDLIVYDLLPGPSCSVYAATSDGLYRTQTTWAADQWELVGYQDEVIYAVTLQANGLPCAGSPQGWAQCGLPPTTTDEFVEETVLVLQSPYPNPASANGSVTIEFSLSESGHARLGVFDVLGRELRRIADADFVAGAHSIQWSTSGLAAGVYLVRVSANAQVETRRLIVQ